MQNSALLVWPPEHGKTKSVAQQYRLKSQQTKSLKPHLSLNTERSLSCFLYLQPLSGFLLCSYFTTSSLSVDAPLLSSWLSTEKPFFIIETSTRKFFRWSPTSLQDKLHFHPSFLCFSYHTHTKFAYVPSFLLKITSLSVLW